MVIFCIVDLNALEVKRVVLWRLSGDDVEIRASCWKGSGSSWQA